MEKLVDFFGALNGVIAENYGVEEMITLSANGRRVRAPKNETAVMAAQKELFDELSNEENKLAIRMPFVEILLLNLMLLKKDVDDVKENEVERKIEYEMELIALYSHSSEYGRTLQNGYQVYFSRAYELFMHTTLYTYENELELAHYLEDIFDRAPFYSVTAIEKKRHKMSGYFDERSSTFLSENEYKKKHDSLKKFVSNIQSWRRNHNETLEQAKEIGLLHLFSCVMQKVFGELHSLRLSRVFTDDNLFHCVRRFELILLNALGWYLKSEGRRVDQAVAKTAKSINLMIGDYEANDPSYRSNVTQFLESEQETSKGKFNQQLFEALANHPLFNLLHDYNHNEDKYRLLLRNSDFRNEKSRENSTQAESQHKVVDSNKENSSFEEILALIFANKIKPRINKRLSKNKRMTLDTKESLVIALDRNFSSVINHSASILNTVFKNVAPEESVMVAKQIKQVVKHVYAHTSPVNGSIEGNCNWMIHLLNNEYGAKE